MTEQQQAGSPPVDDQRTRPLDRPEPPTAPQQPPHTEQASAAALLTKVGDALRGGSAPLPGTPRAVSVTPEDDDASRRSVPTGAAGRSEQASAPRPGAVPRPSVPRAPARPAAGTARQRRARLRLRRIDPWSVFVLALLVSLFLAVVLVVAVVALYAVLEAAGVPDSVNALVAEVTRSPGDAEPAPLLSAGRALTTAGVVAVVDVVLLTALATLSAVLYNLCAGFTGGLEVTLAEEG